MPADLPPRMQRKLEHLNKKLERRATRLERRMGPRHEGRGPHRGAELEAVAEHHARPTFGHRIAQSFIILMVAVAIATVLALLRDGRNTPEAAVALSFFIVGGTFGSVLVNLAFLQRFATRNTILDRLAHASMAGLFMLLGLAVALQGAHDHELASLILAPMAAVVVCDWNKRIRDGRLGKVDGWAAFWPAVVGAVTVCFVDAEEYLWLAAAICAAISVLTQATASMWPPAKGVPFTRPLGGQPREAIEASSAGGSAHDQWAPCRPTTTDSGR